MWDRIKLYVYSVLIAIAVGGLAGLLTMNSMQVYSGLQKPALSPPSIVFPIVWTILYTLMGISAAIIFKSNDLDKNKALKTYAVQLVINFLWTIIFFNLEWYLFAFVWLLLLIVVVAIMIVQFYRIKPLAAWLQIPYLIWLPLRLMLNFTISSDVQDRFQ